MRAATSPIFPKVCVEPYAYDGGVHLGVFVLIGLEIVSLDGAARGHVFRIEVRDHQLALEVVQIDGLVSLGLAREIGRGGSHGGDIGGAGRYEATTSTRMSTAGSRVSVCDILLVESDQ